MVKRGCMLAVLLACAAVAKSANPQAANTPHKVYKFAPLSAGDCRMLSGTVILRPDGSGVFETTTVTYHTHSGDVWHTKLDVVSAGGSRLFEAGTFDSPRMNDGNPPPQYVWSKTFRFDASLFDAIQDVHINFSC